MIPDSAKDPLLRHLQRVQKLYEQDLKQGAGRVPLPDAICRKYPNADREWGWQYVFPASTHYFDQNDGIERRHHLHESVVQKAVKAAVREAKITKPASPIRFVTVSRLIFSRPDTTSGRYRGFSVIEMFGQPWCTHMY